jgi:hypothetical protein
LGNVDNQNGNVAFYVLFVLPVAMALLMIVVDVSSWQAKREEAQSEADRIALQVGRFLPFSDEARSALLQMSAEFNSRAAALGSSLRVRGEDPDLLVSPSHVRIEIQGVHVSGIDFFLRYFTGAEVALQIHESSEARLVPMDSVLIFSDSISLRPPVPFQPDDFLASDSGYASFGDEFEWPASEYFALVPAPRLKPYPEPLPPEGWPRWWEPEQFSLAEFRRWATQTCFNPAVTPVKLSAITIADTMLASPLNRFAVLATPGDLQSVSGFSMIKGISGADSPQWSEYFESGSGICDEACVYYAALSNEYRIPDSFIPDVSGCDEVFSVSPLADTNGHYPNPFQSKLSNCFLQREMSVRESLYYRAVRANTHEADFSNISKALHTGASLLVEKEKFSAVQDAQTRGNLAGFASRIIFLLVDALPDISEAGMQEVLTILHSDPELRFYILAYTAHDLNFRFREFKS